jgi:hypothetical protein
VRGDVFEDGVELRDCLGEVADSIGHACGTWP